MSAMVDMSKAIRHVIEDNAPAGTLQSVPLPILKDMTQIVGSFYMDMKAEIERRDET